jgi:hypothetical protein
MHVARSGEDEFIWPRADVASCLFRRPLSAKLRPRQGSPRAVVQ